MKFIRVEGTSELEGALSSALNAALAKNEPVLWLVPGGSNIASAINVMDQLDTKNLSNLKIMLTDERFGPAGHADSNYQQLKSQGFNIGAAEFKDMLQAGDLKSVQRAYSDEAMRNFNKASIVIAFFGMGPDGHIAGILPHSPASTAGEVWTGSYIADPFTRVTLTPFALSHVNQAFVGAYGQSKLDALTNLHDKTLPITEQPAQILRHLPQSTIYNDQID